MAGRATTPVRGSGAIRRFGADWRSRARSTPPWDWTASIICSSRNWDVPAPTVTACRDRLGETPSLQSHRQLPAQLPSCTEPSATKVLFQPSPGSDITYIPTGEGWLYPSIVKDLCARKIVGYACSERTGASLTPEALHLAVRRCKPPKGFVFHSDRASSTPLGPSGSALSSMKFGRACPQGRSLRQRRGRKFLQMSQVRADPSQTVSHPGQRTGLGIRLSGGLLQLSTATFRIRMAISQTV